MLTQLYDITRPQWVNSSGLNNSKKNHVAHRATCWKKSDCPHQKSGCPLLPSLIVNKKVYDDFMTHSKIKWNINEIRSIENSKTSYTSENKTRWFYTLNKICPHTYSSDVSRFLGFWFLGGVSLPHKRGVLFTEEGAFYTNAIYHFSKALCPIFSGQLVNLAEYHHPSL